MPAQPKSAMKKIKVEVDKGRSLPRGLYAWSVKVVAGDKRLPAGSVKARTKATALKKARAMVKKRYFY